MSPEPRTSVAASSPPVGLYVHVPFCGARCSFCAFYLEVHREDRVAAYLDALRRELELYGASAHRVDRPLVSVYLGGGTPSLLEADQLEAILRWIRQSFEIAANPEITLEAHPDTVTPAKLARLRAAGFNRISFGLQSVDDHERRAVGRPGRPGGLEAIRNAVGAGFENVGVDLMYGLPGQTADSWIATLESAAALPVTHVSCYALTVEEDTRLHLDVAAGRRPGPDENLQVDLQELACLRLEAAGFVRYEISNFARPASECRHNLLYWTDGEYLGVGPSAQSFLDGVRFGNVADLERYRTALGQGRLPVETREPLSTAQRRREAVAFGLRRLDGVPRSWMEQVLQEERPESGRRRAFERFTDLGLLLVTETHVKLTGRGLRHADTVGAEFL